nr:hydroxyacid dehydrogenase [bacterium]
MRVHFRHGFDSETNFTDLLDDRLSLSSGDEVPDPADYEILVAGRPTETLLDASPSLRGLIIPYAGLPTETRRMLRERPQIAVHNLHHNSGPASELALALLLAAAKRVVPLDRRLRKGDWRPRYQGHPVLLLEG